MGIGDKVAGGICLPRNSCLPLDVYKRQPLSQNLLVGRIPPRDTTVSGLIAQCELLRQVRAQLFDGHRAIHIYFVVPVHDASRVELFPGFDVDRFRQRIGIKMEIEPVSYTHLDVYKRQGYAFRLAAPFPFTADRR